MPIHNGWSTGSTYSTTAGSVTIDDIRVADPATALPISATSPITRAVSDVDLLTATAAVLPACSTAACGAAYLGTVGVNAHQGTTLASTYTTLVNDLKDLNLTEVRGGSSWAYVESTKGSYNTGGLGFFSAAMSAGLKSVFVLAYDNPLYDSLQAGKTSCNDGVDDSGGPVTQGFLGYTNAMVKSWGTSSVFWEVWNEPDASYSWNDPTSATCVSYGDDGTRYAPFLAKVLAQAKTTASAQALAPPVLTSAGIGGAADFQMLKAIIGQYVADGAPSDGVAIHPYVGGANFQYPEEILTSYDYLNALLAANFGGAARIWSTESGVATSDFDAHGNYVRCNLSLPYSTNLSTALTNAATCLAAGSDGLSAGGRETQAIFTARGMLTHLTSGIVHDLIYELSDGGAPASGTDLVVPVASDPNEAITRVSDESNFGLLEGNFNYFAPTGGVLGKKPAYYAVKGVTAFLSGKQLDGVVPMSLTGLNALRLRDALHKYVVLWAEDADAQYRVYLPAAATAVLATCGLSSNGAYDNCSGVQPYPTPIGSDAGGDYVTVDRHPLYLTF